MWSETGQQTGHKDSDPIGPWGTPHQEAVGAHGHPIWGQKNTPVCALPVQPVIVNNRQQWSRRNHMGLIQDVSDRTETEPSSGKIAWGGMVPGN